MNDVEQVMVTVVPLNPEEMIDCPACGIPVPWKFMRRLPEGGGVPANPVELPPDVPADLGHDWVCTDCLGQVADHEPDPKAN